jgi:hypothetical protein
MNVMSLHFEIKKIKLCVVVKFKKFEINIIILKNTLIHLNLGPKY